MNFKPPTVCVGHVSRALAAYSMQELARLIGRFYFRLSPNISGTHLRTYKWSPSRFATGACHSSARYLIVFLVCRFIPTRVRSPNSKIDESRSARAYAWPRIAARRRHVTDTSIVIERSNRLTTARLVWREHSSCPVGWLLFWLDVCIELHIDSYVDVIPWVCLF